MRRLHIIACMSLFAGCGEEGSGRDDGGGGGLMTLTSGGSSATQGATEGGTDQATSAGSGNNSSATATGADGSGGGIPNFDVGSPDGGAACGGGMGSGDGTLSHIWIANSSQGSVSKINTQTMIEEGRYTVRPDSAGNPSRTSVSLSGDVAVANRLGGVIKIWENPDNCQENNGVPGIQTSTGGGDILAWGQDECVAWYTPLAYSSNRPLAWAPGEWNSSTCSYDDEKVWTGGANGGGTTQVLLMDGETGIVEQTINLPEVASGIGLYGGAVDGDGHFWGIETGGVRLFRVDRQTFTYQVWSGPGVGSYGIRARAATRGAAA